MTSPQHQLNFSSINRVSKISNTDFHASYFKILKPVIICDMAAAWPALKKWTPDFFKANYGHKQVKVYDASFVEAGDKYMTQTQKLSLADYIEQVMTRTQDLRMFLYNIKTEIPEIAEDVQEPSLVSGISKNFLFMFFGCKGSVTQMHFDIDMAHVFHTAIWGRKTVTLFPYKEGRNLYRNPFTCRSYTNVNEPDFQKYPRLENAKGYQFKLEAGETLFIPSGYWHHIVYDEPGFAISHRCSPQTFMSKAHGYYNLLIMSPIDRLMNKIFADGWFQWKENRAINAS